MESDELSGKIIGCAQKVHNTLGTGFLEKIYENALRLELEEAGLSVQQQVPITVYYRGQAVGEYYADLLVEGRMIVEIKAVQNLAKEHEVQLVHYLTATGIDDGLLLNFGASLDTKHKYRVYRPGRQRQNVKGQD